MAIYGFSVSRHNPHSLASSGTPLEVVASTEEEAVQKCFELSGGSSGPQWTFALQSVKEIGGSLCIDRQKIVMAIFNSMEPGGYMWLAEKMADAVIAELLTVDP